MLLFRIRNSKKKIVDFGVVILKTPVNDVHIYSCHVFKKAADQVICCDVMFN